MDLFKTWQSSFNPSANTELLEKVARLEQEKQQLMEELEGLRHRINKNERPREVEEIPEGLRKDAMGADLWRKDGEDVRKWYVSPVNRGKFRSVFDGSVEGSTAFGSATNEGLIREICRCFNVNNVYELLDLSKKQQKVYFKMERIQDNLDKICSLVFKELDLNDIKNFKNFEVLIFLSS